MGKANLFHHPSGRDIAGSVKRCVNDCNLVLHLVNGLLVHNLGLYLGNVLIVDFFANDFVFACCQCRGLVRGLNRGQILYGQHLVGNALVMGRGELGAVLPVYLVAVVFRRVMACRDINSCNAPQLTHCKGKLRSGTQGLELICLDSVGCQGHGCFHGKFR